MGQARIVFTNARLDTMTAADFETLARLAEVIWRAHYTKIIGSAQVDYMLAGRYTPEKLRQYLNADDRWLMLLRIDRPSPSKGNLKRPSSMVVNSRPGQLVAAKRT